MQIPVADDQSNPNPPSSRIRAKVVDLLRARISTGHYQAGDWLPTERLLAEDLKVDRRAVRMAVNQLVNEGFVSREPNCRPIVSTKRDPAAPGNPEAISPLSPSNFVALIMSHGGVLENQANTSQQRIFWGINQTLGQVGYHTVFLDLGHVGEELDNEERETAHLQYVIDRGFGGAVFYPYAYRRNHSLVRKLMQNTPVVMIDRRIISIESDLVGTSNYQAMFDIISHLRERGHTRIAYATKYELVQPVQDRIQGYIDSVRKYRLDELLIPIPTWSLEQDWTAMDLVFRQPAHLRPTAIAVFNDYAARDVTKRLEELGLSVPGDVAVTGFDDIIHDVRDGVGLTTCAQPYEEIGKAAAHLLLRRFQNLNAPYETEELPATLIIRDSSGPRRIQ